MHFVQAKGILSQNNGMNIYRGCSHGCRHEGYGICGPGAEGILGRMILAAGILKKV